MPIVFLFSVHITSQVRSTLCDITESSKRKYSKQVVSAEMCGESFRIAAETSGRMGATNVLKSSCDVTKFL